MTFILGKKDSMTGVTRFIAEPEIRALTSNKVVFMTWYSTGSFRIKFQDSAEVQIYSDGAVTFIDYMDGSKEQRTWKQLGELANRKP